MISRRFALNPKSNIPGSEDAAYFGGCRAADHPVVDSETHAVIPEPDENTHDSTLHYRTVYLSPKPCTLNPPSEARSPALQLGCLSVILVVSLVAYVHLLPYKENAGSLEHNACRLARS